MSPNLARRIFIRSSVHFLAGIVRAPASGPQLAPPIRSPRAAVRLTRLPDHHHPAPSAKEA